MVVGLILRLFRCTTSSFPVRNKRVFIPLAGLVSQTGRTWSSSALTASALRRCIPYWLSLFISGLPWTPPRNTLEALPQTLLEPTCLQQFKLPKIHFGFQSSSFLLPANLLNFHYLTSFPYQPTLPRKVFAYMKSLFSALLPNCIIIDE